MAHVHIGLPQHGGTLSTATMRSLHDTLLHSCHAISYQCMGLSLLARNFNSLWTAAYKRGADYFVLHHTDIGVESPYPGVCWLDVLIERIQQLQAAVVSIASPIKSKHGHFSMGLDLEPGNPYTLRRCTARELQGLPEMFICRADVCDMFSLRPREAGAMIVNTGVWCMDLKHYPWFNLRWPGFNIVDSIEWSLNGVPSPYTEPEDWYASRWLHEHRLPYYATRELLIDHHGGMIYPNYGYWGDLHDLTPLQPSIEEWHGLEIPMGLAV